MKKLLTGITLFVLVMVILTPIAQAQKTLFSGTIVFDVKAMGDVPEQAKAMLPTEMTLKVTPEKQSMTMNYGMMEMKTISDAATMESNSLMNVMGNKLNLKVTAAQANEQRVKDGGAGQVEIKADTKTIAGFLCKKAVVTKKVSGNPDVAMEVFYTDDIDISKFTFSNPFPEISGLPLEYTMKSGPMSFKMTARSVKKETIPASEFVISSDYKQVTQEELRNMFGGGGQ
jgi:GLPGLI family protein